MKNNKGFTLIELLAVIAILMIILTLITPKVFKQLKTAGEVTDKEQINSIIDTSRLYMNQHSELLPEHNSLYLITLNELKKSGLIKSSQILNPSTNEELTGCVIVTYENNKYNYEYKENNCDKTILVTFDSQGGTINQTTKVVSTTDTYGELPTPTKEGYTFMGWNGKNMLNLSDRKEKNPGGSFQNDSLRNKFSGDGIYVGLTMNNYYSSSAVTDYEIDSENNALSVTSNYAGYGLGLDFKVLPSTEYTVSNLNPDAYRFGEYRQDGSLIKYTLSNTRKTYKITTTNETYWLVLVIAPDSVESQKKDINIQLEEGNTATPYEPYYITSDTTVVQETNHTLKAIWQANS